MRLDEIGELLGAAAVQETLATLAPDRLGHGIRSAEDVRVLDDVVRRGVTLEVCPGSNVALGVYGAAEDVPLRQLVEAGAQIALGADDPLLFGSRLNAQYEIARTAHGLSDVELAELARGSVRGSRAPEPARKQMLGDIDRWLAG